MNSTKSTIRLLSTTARAFLDSRRQVYWQLRYVSDLRHPDQRERFNVLTKPKLIARGAIL